MKRQTTYSPAFIAIVLTLLLSACAPLAYRPSPSGQDRGAPAAEAPASEAAADSGMEESAASAPAAGGEAGYAPAPPTYRSPDHPVTSPNQSRAPVTAGVTDDNANWGEYMAYLNRHWYNNAIAVDVSERYRIQVADEQGRPVHDAQVEIYSGATHFFTGRTDSGGRVLFHPSALKEYDQQWVEVRVVASKGYVAQSATFARGQSDTWPITLTDPARLPYAQLDLLFLVDATGSMGDEIDKLKDSMAMIADEIGQLPARPDVRYGLVAYRDQGDAFVVRTNDFTPDLWAFQRSLAALRADGGGDEPEALNEALHRSLTDLHWRSDETVRLIILVGDAPPHLDYHWEQFNYATDMVDAVRQGIKIFPVGASNLSIDGEYIFRQLAQFTGGKFVFLTYADGNDPSSGPGTETNHDVETYSVDTLDRLVVRLVSEELAQLASGTVDSGTVSSGQSPVPTPTPIPPLQPLSCTLDFVANWSDCDQGKFIAVIERSYQAALLGLKLTPGYARARFAITFANRLDRQAPLVNLADAAGAEAVLRRDALYLFGPAQTPTNVTLDGQRLLAQFDGVAQGDETITLDIANHRLGLNAAAGIEVVESPYLFTLEGADSTLYAAFNRSINGRESGAGVSKVVVTLYPAQ